MSSSRPEVSEVVHDLQAAQKALQDAAESARQRGDVALARAIEANLRKLGPAHWRVAANADHFIQRSYGEIVEGTDGT